LEGGGAAGVSEAVRKKRRRRRTARHKLSVLKTKTFMVRVMRARVVDDVVLLDSK